MLKPSILLSIFKRKGAEGLFTQIITESNKLRFQSILEQLEKNEQGLIAYHKDEKNWFLLSDRRILAKVDGEFFEIQNSNLTGVTLAMQEEFMDGVRDKNNFTRLKLTDSTDKSYILRVEQGQPYNGIYQVLGSIASKQ